MLKIGSKIFDGIFSENNRKKIESFTIWSASIGFIFHLSLVLLNNNSIIDIGNTLRSTNLRQVVQAGSSKTSQHLHPNLNLHHLLVQLLLFHSHFVLDQAMV